MEWKTIVAITQLLQAFSFTVFGFACFSLGLFMRDGTHVIVGLLALILVELMWSRMVRGTSKN